MQNRILKYLIKTALLFSTYVFIQGCSTELPHDYSIIEIVLQTDVVSENSIVEFFDDLEIDKEEIYIWDNRWVIYIDAERAENIAKEIKEHFPKDDVKIFENPFYHFNRKDDCGKEIALSQEHIIMTANLVDNQAMQQEYMDYHNTQRDNWPEVREGFCNADFQHVKVYRNGSRLMLVISIPKGESLDELNPKTVENNPRVVEWNSIMSSYQEGLEDAPDGAAWIEFKKI